MITDHDRLNVALISSSITVEEYRTAVAALPTRPPLLWCVTLDGVIVARDLTLMDALTMTRNGGGYKMRATGRGK